MRKSIVHSWEPNAEKCHIYQSYSWDARAAKLPHEIIDRMNSYLGSNKYRAWSTGALAIWMMIEIHPRVTITGYDWWSRTAHHYADKALRGSMHRPDVEKRLVDRLVEDGRLDFLNARCARHDPQHDGRSCPKCDTLDHDDAGNKRHYREGGRL